MMKRYQKILTAVTLAATLWSPAASRPLWARSVSASVNGFLPAIDDSRYLSIDGSQTLEPWEYRVGSYFHYAKNPVEIGNSSAKTGGVVNHLIVGDFFGSVGLTKWWEIGLSAPVALYEDSNDLVTGTNTKALHMMDLRLETKIRLLDIDQHHVGLSILPYMFIPTGSGTYLVGNNSFAGGGKAIVDFNIANRLQISFNGGYLARSRVVIAGTNLQDDKFTFGMGASLRAADWVDIIAEGYGSTNITNAFKHSTETPVEIDGGLRFNLPNPRGLQVTVGGGAGATNGFGAPDVRAIIGISYLEPRKGELPPPPPPVREEPLAKVVKEKSSIDLTKKIHFEFNQATIRSISFPVLDAIVDILKQNPDIHHVRVEGYTDSKGSDSYNLKLSKRRADAVKDYLVTHGVEADRLVAIGYGKTRAVSPNDTAEGRAYNRRVEFNIEDSSHYQDIDSNERTGNHSRKHSQKDKDIVIP